MDNPLEIKGALPIAFAKLRAMMIEESGGRCQNCESEVPDLDIHHIDGCGLNFARENLAVLCDTCHGFTRLLPDDECSAATFAQRYVVGTLGKKEKAYRMALYGKEHLHSRGVT